MRGVSMRSWRFRLTLIAINIAGLVWIHHDLTRAPHARIRVLSALPTQDVDAADRFSLIFDEPLALATALNAGLGEPPFTIQPHVPGEWVWAAPERVEYRLAQPLPPGRRFTLRPSPQLERLTGRTLVGPSEFRFETAPLRLLSCSAASSDRTHATIELLFNQPVDPAELLRCLKTSDPANGQPLAAECLTRAPSKMLTARVQRPASNRLHALLDGRLAGYGGELGLGASVEQEVAVSPVFAVLRASAQTPGLTPTSTVRIGFSQSPKADQPVPAVQVTPAVEHLQTRLDGEELLLEGAFECGRRYTASVAPTLLTEEDKPLADAGVISFEIPDREPSVRIPFGNGILSPRGNLAVELKAANIAGVRVRAARVHQNNLASHLRGDHSQATSRELPEKTISLSLARNTVGAQVLSLRELIGEPLGVYHLHAAATDRTWTGDHAVVAVTDLGMTCKTYADGLYVWVTSLRTAKPVTGAEVAAVSYNGQTLASSATDGLGVARLSVPRGHPDGKPWVVTARLGDDLSFLQPDSRPWVIEDVEQGGRDIPTGFDVMLYADRGVYQPGETVHLTGIIRDAEGRVPPPFPLAVRVTRPDGREVAMLAVKIEPNRQGVFHVDYLARDDGRTGPYGFTVHLPGAKEALGQTGVLVEEFVPARLEVTATAAQERFGAADPIVMRAGGRYLFGQPASELPVTAVARLARVPFRSRRCPGFSFEQADAALRERTLEASASLDNQGHATVQLSAAGELPYGYWQGSCFVTVTETGGRSVSAQAEVTVDAAGRHLGLKLSGGRIVPAGLPVECEWVQVDGADALVTPEPMAFVLSRIERDYRVEEVNGRLVWKPVERVRRIAEGEIPPTRVDDFGKFEVTCPAAGEYRLDVAECAAGRATRLVFHATEGLEADEGMPSAEPERLELVLDREEYAPGDLARVLVKSPFAGTLLLTVETDRVLDQRVMEVPGGGIELEWPVQDRLRGGAFLVGTVVRAVDPAAEAWMPHRAIGMTRLRTDHRAGELPLRLVAPATARPGETMRVEARTSTPTDPSSPPIVHLWAVDEGILLNTGYETPRPADHFFAPRRTAVTSSDLFGDLLPDYRRALGMARIGGDGGDEAERIRRSPRSPRRRESSVIWLGARLVDSDGGVRAELRLPDMNGQMRLMATAVEGDSYGSAQHALTLTSPLMVELTAPRFAAPDDHFVVPVKVFNATDRPQVVVMAMQSEGSLSVDEASLHQQVTVEPGRPAVAWLKVTAQGIGPGRVRVRASAENGGAKLLASAEASLPVRPAGALHSETRLLTVRAGQPVRVEVPSALLPETCRTVASVSGTPKVQLQQALEDLIEYPYGCLEQTTSRLWALLHAPELLSGIDGADARPRVVAGMIDAGVARLWSMQTHSGGLGYWPGDNSPNLWATAYAAEFIVQARRVGHAVDARFIEDLAAYLRAELGRSDAGRVDNNLRAHLAYVLAAMNQPPEGWLARLSELRDTLDMAGRAHLAGAWLETGRKDRAAAVLSDDLLAQTVATTTGGRLTSQVRQEAVLLKVLLDLDKSHPWIPSLVQRLEQARRGGCWGSTLENATALAALARFQLSQPQAAAFEGVARAGDLRRPFDQAAPLVLTYAGGLPLEVESQGQGNLYLALTTEGLLKEPRPEEYDRQLRVARRWVSRRGEPVDPAGLRVGDLVVVETTLEALGREGAQRVDNVAIVDALPAGLEVENPRLATSEQVDRPGAGPDHVEFRDDRVLIFTSVGGEPRTFRYALRAVTPGSFAWPAIQASCMYDAAFASLHGGGRVEVARQP